MLLLGACASVKYEYYTSYRVYLAAPRIKSSRTPPVASWQGEAGNCRLPYPINFSPSDNFLLVGKCSSCRKIFVQKYAIMGWNSPIFGEFEGKVKFFSTHNFVCRKLAAVCIGKQQLPTAPSVNPRPSIVSNLLYSQGCRGYGDSHGDSHGYGYGMGMGTVMNPHGFCG